MVRIGTQLYTVDGFEAGFTELAALARSAEELGLDSVWLGDHLCFAAPVLESFVAAATISAVTKRIGIAFGVLVPALRNPVWTAKQLSSLQAMSRDRIILGVGVGGEFPEEWQAAGVPRRERGARTDAFLRALPTLLSGKHTSLGPPWGVEVPPLRPHGEVPPLWIGGRTDVALARTVRHGAGWVGVWQDVLTLTRNRDRLNEIADERGCPRPPLAAQILVHPTDAGDRGHGEMKSYMEKIYGIPFDRLAKYCIGGTVDEIAERLAELVAVGLDTVVMIPAVRDPLAAMPAIGAIAERIRPHA